MRCAECNPNEAANYFTEAGNVLRNVNTSEAVTCYNRAAECLEARGSISMAARLYKQNAEIYEADEVLGLAVSKYAHAAELYEMDNCDSAANTCYLKVAELSTFESLDRNTVISGIKVRNIQLFEEVAERYLMHSLTRFSVKECYFKSGILFLANGDTVGAENAMTKYCSKDPCFEASKEHQLIRDLLVAIRAEDIGSFEHIVFSFNKTTQLDRWKTKALLKAKTFASREVDEDFR